MPLINPQSVVARTDRATWLILAVTVALFFSLVQFSAAENALTVALTVALLALFVKAKWESRRDPRLWSLVGVVAAVQVPMLFLVHIPHVSTGLAFYPVGLLELAVLWGLFGWIQRRFPRA